MKIPKARKILQTKFVESTMRNCEPNRLLYGTPSATPEEFDRGEAGLSQKESIPISNEVFLLPSLRRLHKQINSDEPDNCRKCHERETAAHVVECIGGIKCEDLWRSPEGSVSRLGKILA